MTKIEEPMDENARNMLKNRAHFIGWVGQFRFYMLDGKLWSVSDKGEVFRSDDDDETTEKRAQVLKINHITANNYPVRVRDDAEVEIGTSRKQMEANNGSVFLTRRELIAMLAMMEPLPAE